MGFCVQLGAAMTAQVAVFNLECVAVASDSVMTITNGSAERMLPTSDKVLDLGDGHRVVAMSSGSARFMGIPLSVLVGEWAANLAEPFGDLTHYPADFVAWLGQRKDLFDARVQDSHFAWQLRDYYAMVRMNVLDAIHEAGLSSAPWDDLTVMSISDRVIGEAIDAIAGQESLPGISARKDAEYLDRHAETVEYSLLDTTEDMPVTVGGRERLTTELPALILDRAEPWSRDSVLAFIGYGDEDMFPGHQTVTLHGMVNNQVRYDWWDAAQVSPDKPTLVNPFGQDEAISTFLRAYNSEFLTLAHRRIDALLETIDLSGADLADGSDPDTIGRTAHDDLDEDFKALSRRSFIDPLLDTVEGLPRIDMAHMAEALVGVQALRAASTRRQPSVGGPIDVVVISRRHGVQWIRRKEVTLA